MIAAGNVPSLVETAIRTADSITEAMSLAYAALARADIVDDAENSLLAAWLADMGAATNGSR